TRIDVVELAACLEAMGESCCLLLPRDRLGSVPTLDVPALIRKIVARPQLRPHLQEFGSFCQIAVVAAGPLQHRLQKFAPNHAPFRHSERCAAAYKVRCGFARPDDTEPVI